MPNWIRHFSELAAFKATNSKDTNTKVGAVIFDEANGVEVSSGWNDLPRGITHTVERNTAPLKYKLTSHAEISSITNAARMGRATNGHSIVVTMYPCSLCAAALINAGIKKVYSPKPDFNHLQYGEDMKLSQMMFDEVGIVWEEIRVNSNEI